MVLLKKAGEEKSALVLMENIADGKRVFRQIGIYLPFLTIMVLIPIISALAGRQYTYMSNFNDLLRQ